MPKLNVGSADVKAVYAESRPAVKVYDGSVLVYQAQTITDTVPYLLKTSDNDVLTGCKVNELVGATVAFNQLVQNGDFATSAYWKMYNAASGALTISNNKATIVYTGSGGTPYFQSTQTHTAISGHKYLVSMTVTLSAGGTIKFDTNGFLASPQPTKTVESNTRTVCSWVASAGTGANKEIWIYPTTSSSYASGETAVFENIMCIDLTQMGFPVGSLTSSQIISSFRFLFPKDYYAYNTGALLSVKTSGKKVTGATPAETTTYPVDGIELRGLLKLDANNDLYADGDTYASDGTVTRNYGYRAYQAGDESQADAITDGTNTAYKLVAPTTDVATPFTQLQNVYPGGVEEWIDTRAVPMPVGHETIYYKPPTP